MTNTTVCGVYCIENLMNGKRYVGQSIDIYRRWSSHKNESAISRNYFLYQAFRKYGTENFRFYILEECDEDSLNEREIYWINHFDTFNNGYNMTIGGAGYNCGERAYAQNKLPKNFTENICNTVSDIVSIAKLDLDYNILDIYDSVRDCARKNNVVATNVSKCTKQLHKTCGGYLYLRYNEIQGMSRQEIQSYVLALRDRWSFATTRHSNESKAVALIDDRGEIVEIFASTYEAGRKLGVDPSSVTKVCKERLKKTHNMRFKYV